MRSEMKIVLLVVGVIAICCIGFAAYTMYNDMQEQNQELNQSLQQAQTELNESNNNNTTSDSESKSASTSTKKSTSSSSGGSSSSSSASSGNKVTYEDAGVDKDIGYIKTCKYNGCGAKYDSRLSYCPSCGHKNIYV